MTATHRRAGRAAADRPDPADVADDARRAWTALVAVFTSEQHQQRFLNAAERSGLTPGEMRALLTFDDATAADGCPMGSLAQRWHCDASHVTQLVDALEEAGFAERRAAAHDRRVRLVVLTPRGRRARTKVLAELHHPPAAFDALSPAELATLAELLEKVAAQADGSTV